MDTTITIVPLIVIIISFIFHNQIIQHENLIIIIGCIVGLTAIIIALAESIYEKKIFKATNHKAINLALNRDYSMVIKSSVDIKFVPIPEEYILVYRKTGEIIEPEKVK